MKERPLVAYEPNPVLGWLYERFFSRIEVDEVWVRAVREADERGTVVYVLRNLSFVDFFALDHLTKRYGLPQVRFANDLGLWVLEPMGRGWVHALTRRTARSDAEDLRRAVASGAAAALFLKRPPSVLDAPPRLLGQRSARGRIEGDVFLQTLLDVQRTQDRPILLVPQVFLWSRRGDSLRQTWVDAVFGPREWPGNLRTLAQFLASAGDVQLRAGEPLDLRAFVGDEAGATDEVRIRRITYSLLRRLERERRTVVGPARKPADRLREEVLRSPKLQKIIMDLAGEGEAERRVLVRKAERMLRELEAQLDDNAIQLLDRAVDQTVLRMYQAIEVDQEGLERVRAAAKRGTLVLLPSHKSHVDYIILSRVLHDARMQLPLIAAGDNLSFFPLGPILRRAGAFFIRRSFRGDRLYSVVVDAYMRRLLKDGWTLEFFIEGGRSRTGKLLAPKLGLLSIVVDAALGTPDRDIFFVPVSIGYDRVVEESSYVDEVSGGEKQKEDVRGLLKAARTVAGRYGRLSVQFGTILTLEQILREIDPSATKRSLASLTPARRRSLVTRLAHRVLNEIDRATAVTPGALVAMALLTHDRRGLAEVELFAACERLARTLHAMGARFSPALASPRAPGRVRLDALREATENLVRVGHVEVRHPGEGARRGRRARPVSGDAFYVVPDEARLSLDISKNLILHFFVARAVVATALLAPPGPPTPLPLLRERALALSRLFKYEFNFRADASFDENLDETLAAMERDGLVARRSDELSPSEGASEEARAELASYACMLRTYVEGYRVAARALTLLRKGPLAPKDLAKKALAMGERMYLAGDVERREALTQPIFENAFAAFVDQGYLVRTDGKLALSPTYESPEATATIEMRIAAYMERRRART
jgi:glycerol-3-phosphate O-acyltransferase